MAKEYIPLFLDFNEATQDLTDEECGRLVRAIIDYANDQEYESRLTGAERIAFRFLKGVVDRNQAISDKRAKAGANKNKTEQNETNENKQEQNETNFLNKNNNKKENKNKNDNKNERRFTPPSVDEVAEYCRERRNNVDAQTFVDFYASKGWKVGSTPMKDWKACVRTWEQRNTGKGKTVVAQQYSQRDYENVQDELMAEQEREMEKWIHERERDDGMRGAV